MGDDWVRAQIDLRLSAGVAFGVAGGHSLRNSSESGDISMSFQKRTIMSQAFVLAGAFGAVCLALPQASHAAPGQLAARDTGPVKSVDYTCISCDIDDFVAHCDKSKGGLSKNPDGTTTCSIQPNTKSSMEKVDSFISPLKRDRTTKNPTSSGVLASRDSGEDKGVIYRCESDDDFCATVFVTTCEKGGGGASTDPDGGVVCTVN